MNEDFWIECEKVFESAACDPDVRAIVCSAAGDRMFSAGIDLGLVENDKIKVKFVKLFDMI